MPSRATTMYSITTAKPYGRLAVAAQHTIPRSRVQGLLEMKGFFQPHVESCSLLYNKNKKQKKGGKPLRAMQLLHF